MADLIDPNRKGDTYRGKWHQHPTSKEWQGNSADAAYVTDLMGALKHKHGTDGASRQHSRAMQYEDMEKIIE